MEYVLDKFFDEQTMSVHFKENVHIVRKKGRPGNWETEVLEEYPSKNFLQNLVNEFYKEVENDTKSFLEIDRNFSKVFQLGPYRTVVVLPPLSDGIEITVVKPIKKLSLEDYNLDERILDLLKNSAKGILISGAPGEGKTTFAQALVEFYVKQNKIVKTIESPRDLLVPQEVTQYSFSYAPHSEIRDILLLSRPDYTIYDEVRNVDDFILFKDLRLTGIGLVGVIHATNPIDSVQRFLGTIEMGVIPQVIDTIIFIKGGKIDTILTLKQVVKVPEGMESDDLARPVIQVLNFLENKVEYEIYTYGEQVVVMPISKVEKKEEEKEGLFKYAAEYLKNVISSISGCSVVVKPKGQKTIDIFVPEFCKGKIIGKGGENISSLEEQLGLKINVKTIDQVKDLKPIIDFEIVSKGKRKTLVIYLPDYVGQDVNLKIGDEIMTFTVNKKGEIRIKNPDLVKKVDKIYLLG